MNYLASTLSWRYLFSSRQRFVPLLSFVALGGIALGVWSLIVVLSIMQGFQRELHRRWVGLNAHVTAAPFSPEEEGAEEMLNAIRHFPEVAEANPTVEGEIIIRRSGEGDSLASRGQALAAKLKGFESLSPGFLERLKISPPESTSFSLMVGEELADSLLVFPESSVTLLYPFGEIGPSGDWVPSQKTLPVSHTFKTGLYEWDAYHVLVPLSVGLDLLKENKETALKIYLHRLDDLDRVEKKLRRILPPATRVTSFADENRRLFAALKLERLAMGFILFLFALIASMSVVGLLLMFIDAKRRDIALLRAIGASPRGIQGIFLTLGGVLGTVGSLAGGLLALVSLYLLRRFPVQLPDTYYLDTLPSEIRWGAALMVLIVGVFLSLLCAWYPVRVASRVEILPMLREE